MGNNGMVVMGSIGEPWEGGEMRRTDKAVDIKM